MAVAEWRRSTGWAKDSVGRWTRGILRVTKEAVKVVTLYPPVGPIEVVARFRSEGAT